MAWPRWLERGAAIIFDEVFLSGAAAQKRLATVLDGLPVLWVGMRRDPDAAAAREARHCDRVLEIAATQVAVVHQAVTYDIEIDTARISPRGCAQIIVDRIAAGIQVVDDRPA
jgi:chloramphenicol 3-O phosphotransferase